MKWFKCSVRLCALLLVSHWIIQGLGWDGLFQLSEYGRKANASPWLLGSFLEHPNYLAAFFALALPFFFEGRWIWGLVFVVPCLVLQKTTTALVAGSVGFLVWLCIDRWVEKEYVAIFGMIAVGIFLMYQIGVDSYLNNINRLEAWWRMAQEFTIWGHGFGTSILYPDVRQIQSEVVLWVFETGLPGALLMLYVFYGMARKIKELPREKALYGAVTATFLVLMVGTIPCHIPALALIGLIGISQVI